MQPERRAVLLLLALAVAGQGVRIWLTRPEAAPGSITLLAADSSRGLAAQRQRSVALDRPLRMGETIDLDRASVDDVARLPRVGRVLARTIVADRETRGPFGGLEGLDRVAGVGAGLLAVVGPHVSFSGRSGGKPGERIAPLTASSALDLNQADSSALERLPGIGPYMAGRITAYRREHGSFSAVEDLVKVGGIGPSTLAKVRTLITVR